jgi:hypothetical protein
VYSIKKSVLKLLDHTVYILLFPNLSEIYIFHSFIFHVWDLFFINQQINCITGMEMRSRISWIIKFLYCFFSRKE